EHSQARQRARGPSSRRQRKQMRVKSLCDGRRRSWATLRRGGQGYIDDQDKTGKNVGADGAAALWIRVVCGATAQLLNHELAATLLLTGRTTTGFSRLSRSFSVSWRITRDSPARSAYSTFSGPISTSSVWPRYVTGNRSIAFSSGARRGQNDKVPS